MLIARWLGLITLTLQAADFVPGKILIQYAPDVLRTSSALNGFYHALGASHITPAQTDDGYETIDVDPRMDITQLLEELGQTSFIAHAQPDYLLRIPSDEPSEPEDTYSIAGSYLANFFRSHKSQRPEILPRIPRHPQEGFAESKAPLPLYLEQIGLRHAWKKSKGSYHVIVGILDTGIDYNHQDLQQNLWRNPNPQKGDLIGYDFVHEDGLPFDENGHGTHVAGIIAGMSDQLKGVTGVAPLVSLMTLKFLNAQGMGSTSNAISAIDYALAHGVNILNNSWGSVSLVGNPALEQAIERAKGHDVLFIAASGNDGINNDGPRGSYPGRFKNDNLISVAAVDDKNQIASFSNRGPKTTHIAAPGVNIRSTTPWNRYETWSGTSMAAPIVTGAVVLMKAKEPHLTYQELKAKLLQSALKLPQLSGYVQSGLLDFKALFP